MSGFVCTIGRKGPTCPACGSDRFEFFARVSTPYLDRSERYEIVACSVCGHGMAMGQCDQELLAAIYSGPFFASSQQSTVDPKSPINVNARKRAAKIARSASGRLLDIGSGSGAFLNAARADFEVEGVEFSQDAAETARRAGLTVHVGDFMALDLPGAAYDVITLWDVLASLPDPKTAIGRCCMLLKPGGLLIATLPMIDSLAARTLRRTWPLLIPPVNLHYFTKRSLKHLSRQAEFRILWIRFEGKQVALQFVAQKAMRSLGFSAAADQWVRFVPTWSVRLNTGDIATVAMCKAGERRN